MCGDVHWGAPFIFYIVAMINAHQFGQYERDLNIYQYFSNGTTYT